MPSGNPGRASVIVFKIAEYVFSALVGVNIECRASGARNGTLSCVKSLRDTTHLSSTTRTSNPIALVPNGKHHINLQVYPIITSTDICLRLTLSY